MSEGPVQWSSLREVLIHSVMDEIFGETWVEWEPGTPEVFQSAINTLMTWGVPKEVIADVLSNTTRAIREEYGD
jgi:hypothetical protein